MVTLKELIEYLKADENLPEIDLEQIISRTFNTTKDTKVTNLCMHACRRAARPSTASTCRSWLTGTSC